jgi:hypothetical protein
MGSGAAGADAVAHAHKSAADAVNTMRFGQSAIRQAFA